MKISNQILFNGYYAFKQNKVMIIGHSGDHKICQMEGEDVYLRKMSDNKIYGFCSCKEFKQIHICIHVTASIHKLYNDGSHSSAFVWKANFIPEDVSSSSKHRRLLNIIKTEMGVDSKEEIFPQSLGAPFNEIFYEIALPRGGDRFFEVIFHTANRLKSGKMGKSKNKNLKKSELKLIQNNEDQAILRHLMPYFTSNNHYNDDFFNSAEVPLEEADYLIRILQTNRAFIQEYPGDEDSEYFQFLNYDPEKNFDVKIKINSELRTLTLAFYSDGREIQSHSRLFIFHKANLALLDKTFYPVNNYLKVELLNYLYSNKKIEFDENDFNTFRDESLSNLDHRAFAKDYFGLPVKEAEAAYVVHLKLPLNGDYVNARFMEDQSPLHPPFDYLTVLNDEKKNEYKKMIYEKTGHPVDHDGFFSISTDVLHEFIQLATDIGLRVKADQVSIKSASNFHLSTTHDLNWFEINGSVMLDGKELSIPTILKNFKVGESLVEFKKGELTYLPQSWLKKLKKLSEVAEYVDGKFVVHNSRALQLEGLEVESLDLTNFISKIKNFKSLPDVSVSKGFKGELRDYQKFSLKWMKFLRELGLGGCLADDMGLGKTVQVAANLQVYKQENKKLKRLTLIVCPKSLIFNWREELKKFTPNLNVVCFEGGKISMAQVKADILITTYGLVHRNCEELSKEVFDYIVLDEAQAIKNVRSLTAKAIFSLKGEHRLALTGTPVENHVGELYSIFNFLMPGVYKKLALNPDRSNKESARSLKPFILRRTKEQVLKELPDRVEQLIYCNQEDDERKHYAELKEFVVTNLNKKLDMDNFRKSSFMVLEALTRLRQAACHPGLINPELKHLESGKIVQLREMLTEILTEKHKVIIFSQFTSLLKLFREKLEMDENNSVYLDGETRDRQKVVNDFKTDENKNVFFLSLKAGGTGLNLTEASYCFLLDPWWNPAVEDQAIGRLHRMGQKKSVNVYRLISKNSIEEKVMELQKIKSDIVKDVLADETEGFIRTMSKKDLEFLMG